MNIGYRVFVVEEDSIVRISQKLFNDLSTPSKPLLPKLAGRTITVAAVFYTLEKKLPKQIVQIDCQRVKINSDGSIDQENQWQEMRIAANRLVPVLGKNDHQQGTQSGIIDAGAQFDKRRWAALHPELSGPALNKILKALFG
jgi:hypothetical protein